METSSNNYCVTVQAKEQGFEVSWYKQPVARDRYQRYLCRLGRQGSYQPLARESKQRPLLAGTLRSGGRQSWILQILNSAAAEYW